MFFESDIKYTSFISFILIILCWTYGLQKSNNSKLYTQDAFAEIRLNFTSYDAKSSLLVTNGDKVEIKPQKLNFKIQLLNEIYKSEFVVHNPSTNQTIELLYIKSQNELFYSSYPQNKVILPSQSLHVNVYYCSTELQNISSSFLLGTSLGVFEYLVSASTVSYPRSDSLVGKDGAIIPVIEDAFPLIRYIHPLSYRPFLVRVYLMSGDVYIELSQQSASRSADNEKSQYQSDDNMQQIHRILRFRPFILTKWNTLQRAFMNFTTKVFFLSLPVDDNFDNHDLYRHILENYQFEWESSSTLVINTIKWRLINSYSKLTSPHNNLSDKTTVTYVYSFKPRVVSSQIQLIVILSSLFLQSAQVQTDSSVVGDLIIKKGSSQREISLRLSIESYSGTLLYNQDDTMFSLDPNKQKESRKFIVENAFDTAIRIIDIELKGGGSHFSLTKTYKREKLPPGASMHLFTLSFQSSKVEQRIPSDIVYVYTNISITAIPLMINFNKLTMITSSWDNVLDLGTFSFNEKRTSIFSIVNNNSAAITVGSILLPPNSIVLELLSIHNQYDKSIFSSQPKKLFAKPEPLTIPPFCVANFRIIIHSQTTQGNFSSFVTMSTDYQKLHLDIVWRIIDGSVHTQPSIVKIMMCYPGKTCYSDLIVRSTFTDFHELKSVRFLTNHRLDDKSNCEDVKFKFEPSPGRQLPMLLRPNESTVVGRIALDLGDSFQSCLDTTNRHIGFSSDSSLGKRWLDSVSNMSDISIDVDQEIWQYLNYQWQYFISEVSISPYSLLNSLLTSRLIVDTNQFSGFYSNIEVELSWPKLSREVFEKTGNLDQESGGSTSNFNFLRGEHYSNSYWHSNFFNNAMTKLQDKPKISFVDFGLTQLGNMSTKRHVLSNDADVPVVVHVVPVHLYPNHKYLLSLLGLSQNKSEAHYLEESPAVHVTLSNQSQMTDSSVAEVGTLLLSLPPRSNISINIHFRPSNSRPLESCLLLRNNLTGIEVVQLSARVAQGKLIFKNLPTKNSDPLLFELTEKHLKNCDKSTQMKGVPPNFTVRRPLVIQNGGLLPVYIHGFNFEPFDYEEDLIENVLTRVKPWVQPLTAVVSRIQRFCESSLPESIIGRSSLTTTWCRGYGFEVQDCHGFLLKPNASKKLQITFTPDFSLHKVLLYLRVHTSLNGPVHQYYLPVKATLPAHMLSRCSQALERPEIEVFLWYGLLAGASILSLLIVALAYFNADSIFTHSVLQRRQVLMASQCSNSRGNFSSPSTYMPRMFSTSILPNLFSFSSGTQESYRNNYYSVRDSVTTYASVDTDKTSRASSKFSSSIPSGHDHPTTRTIMASKVEPCSGNSELEISRRTKKSGALRDNDLECSSSGGKPIILSNGATTLEQRTTSLSHEKRSKLHTAVHWIKSVFNYFYYSQGSVMRSKLRPNPNMSQIPNSNTSYTVNGGKRQTNRSASNNNKLNQKSSNSPLLKSANQYSPSNHNRSNKITRSRIANRNSVNSSNTLCPPSGSSNSLSIQNFNESNPIHSLSTPDFAPIDIPVPDCKNSGSNNKKNYSKKVKRVIEECFAKQSISRYYNQNDDNTSVMTDSSLEEKMQVDNNSARDISCSQSKKRKSQTTHQQNQSTNPSAQANDTLSSANLIEDAVPIGEFTRESPLNVDTEEEDDLECEEEVISISNNHQFSDTKKSQATMLHTNDNALNKSARKLFHDPRQISLPYQSLPTTTTTSVNKVVPIAVAKPAPRGPLTSIVKPVMQHNNPTEPCNATISKPSMNICKTPFQHSVSMSDKNQPNASKDTVKLSGNWSNVVSSTNANSSARMVPLQQMHHHHHHHHHTHLELSMRTQSPAPGTRTAAGSVSRKYMVQQSQQSKIYSDSSVGSTAFYNGSSPMHWHGVVANNPPKSSPIPLHHSGTFPKVATAAYHPARHRVFRTTTTPALRAGPPLQAHHILYNCSTQPVTGPAGYHSIHSHQPVIASPFIPAHPINRVASGTGAAAVPMYTPGPYYTPYSNFIPVTSTLSSTTGSPLHIQTNNLPKTSSRCSSSQSDNGNISNIMKQHHVLPSCVLQELNSPQLSPEKSTVDSGAANTNDCKEGSAYSTTAASQPTTSMNNKYELPRITKGRRQLMLEYERRYQLRKDANAANCNDTESSNNLCDSVDFLYDNASDVVPSGTVAYEWEQNPLSWTHEQTSNYWDDIEPGSIEDHLANNLLPPNLLGSDSSGMGVGAMPDAFDDNNFDELCYDPSIYIFSGTDNSNADSEHNIIIK